MNQEPVVVVEDLCKTYRDGLLRRRKIEALRGVSFQVGPGEVFGLLGPNGAGKTTLIKILLGIVRTSGGRAALLGRPASDRRGRKRVGYLPESHRIPQHLTGNTALEYFGSLSGLSGSRIRDRRPQLLEMVGLAEWGKTTVKKYSKGMQQRLGLAQAMLHEPDLLILDEPTDGVDPVGRSEMRKILTELKEHGKSIFINSHLLQEIELVCDRVAILDKGCLRHVGEVQALTELSGTEVLFKLSGNEQNIRKVLESSQVISWNALESQSDLLDSANASDGHKADFHQTASIDSQCFQISIRATEQSMINGVVDSLRQSGISILSMTPRRLTLEQAFLQLVNTADDSDVEPNTDRRN